MKRYVGKSPTEKSIGQMCIVRDKLLFSEQYTVSIEVPLL